MKRTVILLLSFLPLALMAQGGEPLPGVTIRDLNNEPVELPYLGERNLLIFYIDPDHGNQNKELTDYLEENVIVGDNIYCCGIINLKDAPLFPNGMLRSILRKKQKKTGSDIYTDPDHILRDAWQLGEVNNLFTFIFVNRDRKIVWLKKGKLSREETEEFFRMVEMYK